MYCQLGEIRFEGLKGIDALTLKSEQVIIDHQLIEGKPRLQNAGSKADELSLSLSIKSAFADPEKEYAALKEYQKTATILPLINGRGELLGDFVIKSMELSVMKTTDQGQWVEIAIAMELIEDFNPDRQKQAELDAKENGFANLDKMAPKTATIPVASPAGLVMQDVTKTGSDAKAADSFLDKARKFGDQANSWMDQASLKLLEVRTSLSGIQDKINNSTQLGTSATNLLNQIPALQLSVTNLLSTLSLHDLQASLALNQLFQGQISLMMINAAPLSNLVATQS